MVRYGSVLAVGMFAITMACAQTTKDAALSAQVQRDVVEHLSKKLVENYVFPDVAKTIADGLRREFQAGDFDKDKTEDVFAEHLSKDMRELGRDRHLEVNYDPKFQTPRAGDTSRPTQADMDVERAWVNRSNGGIASVKHLPGNIGYIDLREFPPSDFVAARYRAAMVLLSGSDGVIVDLRKDRGGDPHSVALFLSYFFAEDDGRHLNDIYWRKDGRTDQFWTSSVEGPRLLVPVYVLTSANTFSGGEECAYDFQTQKRATLVGAVTGGGANPGDAFPLIHGFVANIPTGRAINPITKTNWEHVGVTPDIAVSPSDALSVAYKALIEDQLKNMKDGQQRARLQSLLKHANDINGGVATQSPAAN